ncbi:unnamed protein product [Lactuca saligna]|uniref:DUF676 domain-containing protein n=1 Tax=Lactuca saligna TaxID=75948 RepID=A0AA35ZL40_LACSI|nr:unnamed protein product [Lactuca saligna]
MFGVASKPRFSPLNFDLFTLGFRFGSPRFLSLRGDSGGEEMEFVRKLGGRCCFVQSRKKNHKVEVIESDNNVVSGEDISDAVSAGAMVPPDHLVIMVNGIIGSAADWRYAAQQFLDRLPDKVIVHCSECNCSTLTFDGVDRMGERLAEEVIEVAKRWPEVSKISFVSHSLVATPHLGSRGHRQLPILCGLPFLERRAPQTAHWLVGRSGKHLFLTDNDVEGQPLLLRMVYDSEDIKFMSALRSFKRRVAYANANYDHVVGWNTSSIRRQHELPKPNLLVKDKKYPHIVYVQPESDDIIKNEGTSSVGAPQTLEEEMLRGLTQVPWERVDVSFHKSTQRYIAHSTIQVKSYWLNSDGADVVLHMIDNFVL